MVVCNFVSDVSPKIEVKQTQMKDLLVQSRSKDSQFYSKVPFVNIS